jgi:hypothetical protein
VGWAGLARLATSFFLKDDLHLSPAEMAALTGIFSLPWLIKVTRQQSGGWDSRVTRH